VTARVALCHCLVAPAAFLQAVISQLLLAQDRMVPVGMFWSTLALVTAWMTSV
jgi:hypothetical protein